MSTSFLGVGWKHPVSLDRGQIALSAGEESIREAIWIILATARGERQMRPDFGCGIHDLVFATNSAGTAGRVATGVREALVLWEPRIDLENVDVTSDPEEPCRLLIQIEYRVRSNNNRVNLVYPFYLE
jgi:phage baseplate assembly protein W